jgi:hypothetical protein
LVTKQDGTVDKRYDYAPFGEELTVGVDGRIAPYSAAAHAKLTP